MSLLKKLPSYERLLLGASAAVSRFPLVLLSAILGTAFLVMIIENEKGPPEHTLVKLTLTCALGISLFFGLATLTESKQWKKSNAIVLHASGVVLLVLYFLFLTPNPLMPYLTMIRFALLLIALHFMVAFLPFMGGGQVNGFWQYNKSLFMRFLISALFSAVMFAGLAFALLAAKELFGLKFPDRRYFQLWIIIVGVFNTWIFLAGVPRELRQLNEDTQYPNVLKIFTQYILLPLVALYLVILYAYELKIIFNWNWPKGWVSQLVSWFSVAGILSLLLLWPLRELTENRWIRTFTRWFFRALIPLIVMLFMAILQRVGVYGITINRFLVLAMATGLAIVTLYFVLARKKDIRFIPIIVFAIALLSAYGPWSAFTISQHSQQARLGVLLSKSGVVSDGKIIQSSTPIAYEQRGEISDVIGYLAQWHGVNSFSAWINDSTLNRLEMKADRNLPDTIAGLFGIEYVSGWKWQKNNDRNIYSGLKNYTSLDISGYDRLFVSNYLDKSLEDSTHIIVSGPDTCRAWLQPQPPALMISLKPQSKFGENLITFALSEPLRKLTPKDDAFILPDTLLTFETAVGNFTLKAIIKEISAGIHSDSIEVNSLSAYILLGEKKAQEP
ncbi:MAG TPA: hypothetical protein DEO84_03750 [candidate division Zixibacteria bacterium]|nr:hypothetical protein [candidate division Zixibacteria bacterium]